MIDIETLICDLNRSSLIAIYTPESDDGHSVILCYYANGCRFNKTIHISDLEYILSCISDVFLRSGKYYIKCDDIVDISDTQIQFKNVESSYEYYLSITLNKKNINHIKTSIRQYKLNQIEELIKI